ncbi:FkbM family methyltransferase [Patescibacteria group bacterium]|nr:FkbM family methyltransferase [Patescibacteria group bacterium]MBU4367580.1 FkbM family methyltransferase [Patescibacteria group bacterium]MBU4461620.1 FkbM family methyltransferase [Patescibacteria group bacterium]MCG2699518.1 FkbM family methyltransferase [Candidatus Parcubacteria bacterium]
MNNNSSQDWKSTLKGLLNRLSIEDRYRCASGIPGPILEMRSGTLPGELARGNRILDPMPLIAGVTGLNLQRLRKCAKEIANEYSFKKILDEYNAITVDFRSRLILLRDYVKAFIHRLHGLSINSNPININKIREIQLCIRNQIINIIYPADLVSLGLLWEIFAEEIYYLKNPVKCIYDLGANIGFSAVYFHLLNPSAELVCVKPMEENLRILERNLHSNNINAKIIRAAVGDAEGQTTLFFSDQSHALPSAYTKQPQFRQVSILPFDRIISGKGYGLKIDIEGAERFLSKYPAIIENANWIVGELHYSGDIEQDSRIDAFFDIVKRNFTVEKGRPIVYFIGNEVLLCETFKTLKKIPRG